MERRVIVIVGPTASGKTALGVEVAERLQSEIISADSRQFYKLLDIGTAKPSKEELSRVKHHFIDSHEINDVYNVSDFEKDALEVIEKLQSENKIPVVVGGSGLYVKAIVDGIMDVVTTDENYRAELTALREEKGNEYLHGLLAKVDPVSAARMLPQNWKRVMRALEVYRLSGKPIWQLQAEYKREDDFRFFQFGLNWKRAKLYERIEKRVDEMIKNGLVDEVKRIKELGFSAEKHNALNTVGYKEIFAYLDGEITLERAVELIKRNTRRYAKRQLTWFRKDERIVWLDVDENTDFGILSEKIIARQAAIKN